MNHHLAVSTNYDDHQLYDFPGQQFPNVVYEPSTYESFRVATNVAYEPLLTNYNHHKTITIIAIIDQELAMIINQ